MTPLAAASLVFYRRAIETRGQAATYFRARADGTLEPIDTFRVSVLNYAASELAGSIRQGDLKIIALAEQFDSLQWPRRRLDGFILDGALYHIEAIDDRTRTVDDVLLAIEFQCRGGSPSS